MIGVVDLQCSPKRMIKACAEFVSGLCEATYGRSPELVIDGATETTFTYVPIHVRLYHQVRVFVGLDACTDGIHPHRAA